MANLVETMERKAFGVAVDATLKNLNKDREKALLQIVDLTEKFMGNNFSKEAYDGARAMIKNAPILILDEATAFADPDNEAKVQAAFSRLSQGKTVIMIAHRLSSVIDADRIFVLRDGEICQSGTHKELEKADGLYAHMWKEYNQSVCWKVGA